MKAEDLETGERFIWNWQQGRASDFYRVLIKLITRADPENRARISLGFPEEVLAYQQYHVTPGWWDELQARMAGEEPEEEICNSCALDKHSCIDVEGRPKITECPNHIFKEAKAEKNEANLRIEIEHDRLAKIEADKAEAAQQEALKPDKEKLRDFADSISLVINGTDSMSLTDKNAQIILQDTLDQLESIFNELVEDIENL